MLGFQMSATQWDRRFPATDRQISSLHHRLQRRTKDDAGGTWFGIVLTDHPRSNWVASHRPTTCCHVHVTFESIREIARLAAVGMLLFVYIIRLDSLEQRWQTTELHLKQQTLGMVNTLKADFGMGINKRKLLDEKSIILARYAKLMAVRD